MQSSVHFPNKQLLNLLTYQKSTKVGNTGSYLETNLSQSLLASMKQDNPIESATNQWYWLCKTHLLCAYLKKVVNLPLGALLITATE